MEKVLEVLKVLRVSLVYKQEFLDNTRRQVSRDNHRAICLRFLGDLTAKIRRGSDEVTMRFLCRQVASKGDTKGNNCVI